MKTYCFLLSYKSRGLHGVWLGVLLLLSSGCATLPGNVNRPVSHALTDTDQTSLGKQLAEEKKLHPNQSGFVLLSSGLDAFVARLALAEKAEESIDVQYYLIHKDLTGFLFINSLIKAADRGVRVRLLVDDIDLKGRDQGAATLDSHPNISVRLFNPFSRKSNRLIQYVTRLGDVTRRMHNKSFTVDNQATILGGRNIGNEYFEADPDLVFGDLDVMAVGSIVGEVSSVFDLYWNSELAYPASVFSEPFPYNKIDSIAEEQDTLAVKEVESEYLAALRNSELAEKLRSDSLQFYWGDAELVYDRPEKILHSIDRQDLHLSEKLAPHVDQAQKELIIFSPYFVPGKEGVDFFRKLVQKGVKVRILTNSLASTDVSIVHAGYAKYRKDLLRWGVELFELNKKISNKARQEKKGEFGSSKASLHAKSFVIDREQVFIGSLNLDPRSFYENTEIGVVVSSKEIAEGMGKWFDENIEKLAFRLELKAHKNGQGKILWHGMVNGEKKVFNVDPFTGFWRRFRIGFMKLLPIESQL